VKIEKKKKKNVQCWIGGRKGNTPTTKKKSGQKAASHTGGELPPSCAFPQKLHPTKSFDNNNTGDLNAL
jgi:hypothetical protein